jgi:putative colanic acid biosynthesis glycosyltransferase
MASENHADGSDSDGIAIVTVCLDDLQGLRRTFDSVASQSLQPAEWIVADGGSTDGTVEWLEGIRSARTIWSSRRDGGIYEGMNRGLSQVSSRHVLFLNSGDTLASADSLQPICQALQSADEAPALLLADCYVVEANGESYLRRARRASWVPLGMPTSHQAMVFRTDAIASGFDTRFRLSGDYAAVAKLYAEHRGRDFLYVPSPLCRFHLGGRSDQHRQRGLQEDRRIRREILGMGPITAGILHVAHSAQGWIKRNAPTIHRLIRYQ